MNVPVESVIRHIEMDMSVPKALVASYLAAHFSDDDLNDLGIDDLYDMLDHAKDEIILGEMVLVVQ